jgi:hypothetical protein
MTEFTPPPQNTGQVAPNPSGEPGSQLYDPAVHGPAYPGYDAERRPDWDAVTPPTGVPVPERYAQAAEASPGHAAGGPDGRTILQPVTAASSGVGRHAARTNEVPVAKVVTRPVISPPATPPPAEAAPATPATPTPEAAAARPKWVRLRRIGAAAAKGARVFTASGRAEMQEEKDVALIKAARLDLSDAEFAQLYERPVGRLKTWARRAPNMPQDSEAFVQAKQDEGYVRVGDSWARPEHVELSTPVQHERAIIRATLQEMAAADDTFDHERYDVTRPQVSKELANAQRQRWVDAQMAAAQREGFRKGAAEDYQERQAALREQTAELPRQSHYVDEVEEYTPLKKDLSLRKRQLPDAWELKSPSRHRRRRWTHRNRPTPGRPAGPAPTSAPASPKPGRHKAPSRFRRRKTTS